MRDFAFIQTAPQRLFVGWGPFEQLPFRRPERPAFYVTDFFLDDPHPWRHPAEWEELSVEEFAERIGEGEALRVDWHPAPNDDFAHLFRSAQDAMSRGVFSKIVPIVFETGEASADPRQWLVNELKSLPGGMWAYGYSYHSHGMIGATPELLFRSERRGYTTMALAGTRPVARAEELLRDPKELREHRFVVDDIVRRLAPFGNLELGPIGVMRLPNIAHLITPIYFAENGAEKMSFAEMIRRLHPTAALGVSPRNEAGERWLREADRGVKRRSFGAPFGLEKEDRSALAVVSIRNVQWHGTSLRVGSGAGLLAESQLERELEELRQKRAQVKALFGLDALVPA
ncbi:MAG TPA: chorismate-binding protein [Thermoanaerobaculia bacterium]|jgi:menaquinone-specific isochorismate synthase|nr:chorismate-binding protein [Thermoanaerobaculia bacterium]